MQPNCVSSRLFTEALPGARKSRPIRARDAPHSATTGLRSLLAIVTPSRRCQSNRRGPSSCLLVKHILTIASTRTLCTAVAAAFAIAACSGGDEYTEDGQLVEKTDVRVTGVDFGRGADAAGRITDETDAFSPNDTIYASVHTKGSSPKTVLGVYWRNPAGDEIGMENRLIRPAGDTSTVFVQRYIANRGSGSFSLDMRVNGKVVKSAKFIVGAGAREAIAQGAGKSDASTEGTGPDSPSESKKTSGFVAAVSTAFSTTTARLRSGIKSATQRVLVLTGGEPKEQSPFEWKGLRAGMRFSKLDRLSTPGSPWKRTPFIITVLGFERSTASENENLVAGSLQVIADTAADRVLEVSYAPRWIPKDSSNRLAFEREMVALGYEWDKMPGVIRQQTGQTTGPYFFQWVTPDSTWRATISYDGSVRRAGRPASLRIDELNWSDRALARLSDSVSAARRNANSNYYPQRPRANAIDSAH
jgi:hypothetical protein